MELGDTAFPRRRVRRILGRVPAPGRGLLRLRALRTKLAQPRGWTRRRAHFADGVISRAATVASRLTELAGASGIEADGEIMPGHAGEAYTQAGYGAHFAEVGVDIDTGEIRVRRMLGVFAAGRILNAKTARCQAIGGMVFGVGAALTEDVVVDKRFGFFVNHDLAEYHMPVHADIPNIDAIFLPELDDKANPLKSKGVGELGISGAGAAMANAVYNACGVRMRDYPITLDKVIAGLEAKT